MNIINNLTRQKVRRMHKNKDATARLRWSPRPPKSYPKSCACHGLPVKHGGYARKIPIVWSSPKQKDQIIQKWDPVAKRLFNVKCVTCKEPEYYPNVPSGWNSITYIFTYNVSLRFFTDEEDIYISTPVDVNPEVNYVSYISIPKTETIFPRVEGSFIELYNTRTKMLISDIKYHYQAADVFPDKYIFAIGEEAYLDLVYITGYQSGDIIKFTFLVPSNPI